MLLKVQLEVWAWESSKDKYGTLIHSLALASISLHLSVAVASQDIEAESKQGRTIYFCLFAAGLIILSALSFPLQSFLSSFSDSHLSSLPFPLSLSLSRLFSLPLYDQWKLYGDSASAQQRVADAIGWLALHPHSWLAAGLSVGFNQLGGSVCRSVCSDVSCLSRSVPLLHHLGLVNRLLC